jgi:hypothetical protein
MKRLLAIIFAAVLFVAPGADARGGHSSSSPSLSHSSPSAHSSHPLATTGEHHVKSYTKKDGAHVQGHFATNPNGTKNDNYSTTGNVNPHTGKKGTKKGDGQ